MRKVHAACIAFGAALSVVLVFQSASGMGCYDPGESLLAEAEARTNYVSWGTGPIYVAVNDTVHFRALDYTGEPSGMDQDTDRYEYPIDEALICNWDFGDGNGAQATVEPDHEYTSAGTYTATLSVDDEAKYYPEDPPPDDTLTVYAIRVDSVTVTSGATQTNVTGAKNWAAVKAAGDVIIQATIYPAVPEDELPEGLVTWTGGSPVTGHPLQRKVSKATSAKTRVTATCGTSSDYVDIWIVWAGLALKIGAADTIDSGNDASNLVSGNWPNWLGGGNHLGTIGHDGTPSLSYTYTIGKMEARATLSPVDVEDVVETAWHMKRIVNGKAWDNGGHYVWGTWYSGPNVKTGDDTSLAGWTDLDPDSGTSTRELYDLDAPGCSAYLSGTTVYYTSESYGNFTQYVTVDLPNDNKCSDDKPWSYQAWVDMDKASGQRAEKNELKLSHITIPSSPHYAKRSPTVTSIGPDNGPVAGGTSVTITGTNFTHTTTADPTVTVGGNAATNVVLVNTTTITCTTPAGSAGAKDVVVTVPDGQSATLPSGFTYTQ